MVLTLFVESIQDLWLKQLLRMLENKSMIFILFIEILLSLSLGHLLSEKLSILFLSDIGIYVYCCYRYCNGLWNEAEEKKEGIQSISMTSIINSRVSSQNTKLNQYIGRRSNQICLSFSYFEMHYHVFLIDLLEIDKLKLHYYYLCTRLPIWLLEKRDKD